MLRTQLHQEGSAQEVALPWRPYSDALAAQVQAMNPIAERLSEASVVMEGTPHPELVEMLRIAATEIDRLQRLVDAGIDAVWHNRRFYFKALKSPPNTPLAIIFNDILEKLGQTKEQGDENWKRFYPERDRSGTDGGTSR